MDTGCRTSVLFEDAVDYIGKCESRSLMHTIACFVGAPARLANPALDSPAETLLEKTRVNE